MKRHLRPFAAMMCVLVAVLCAAGAVPARDRPAADRTAAPNKPVAAAMDRWLVLGPFASPVPAFGAEEKEPYGASRFLSYEEIPLVSLKPAAGAVQATILGRALAWTTVAADTGGAPLAAPPGTPAIAYLAAWVEAPRWMKVKVSARSTSPFRLLVDGAEIAKGDGGAAEKSGEAKLEPGAHLVVVKTVRMPADTTGSWRAGASIAAVAADVPAPVVSIDPARPISIREILDLVNVTSLALSPDGAVAACAMAKWTASSESQESWIELRSTKDGSLLRAIRDCKGIGGLRWAPVGRRLAYTARGDGELGTIRVLDLETGEIATIVERVKDLGGFRWSRDGSFLVYSIGEEREPDKRGVRLLTKIEDRWESGRERSHLYLSTVPGGMTRRLTAGPHGVDVRDVHPDGVHLLATREYEDLSRRPYGTTELVVIDARDGSVEELWKGSWLNDVSWSPDGKTILVQAGPSAFGPIGVNVPEGTIPNDYDGQLYLFDPATKGVEPLTRDFDPAVSAAHWLPDGSICVVAETGACTGVYRCNPRTRTFKRLETGFEVAQTHDVAASKPVGVFFGGGAVRSNRLYAIDLSRGSSRMIHDPNPGAFDTVRQGAVESWSFVSSDGATIDGYYYLPPDFDPSRKYPCIVYYYGGTSPIERSYGGRYPKNLWAAHGYVVYVPEPSGATGYGQAFSAAHVNDWGKRAAGEIIEGATKFAEAHPFVDRARLGCIGASFGGFMTELLVTRTNLFAAAVSHAGISFIGSYWGEGYWGYSYNAVAAAESFPWNRRDIYVDQSPLFAADRVTTPILLTHGADDTNVPPGESEQFFTALKLLGKTVAYVKVEGQNHAIMQPKKREIWSKTIIAWFDRFLKNEPEWWNDLYPEQAGAASVSLSTPPARSAAPPAPLAGTVVAKADGAKVVIGETTRAGIDEAIAGWDAEYFDYRPDESLLGEIAGRLDGVDLVVVLGTWCSDSRREVPRLWKVLDAVGFPAERMRTFAVESARAKSDAALTPELLDWSKSVRAFYGITAVESVIVYRGGVELGRIVEAPAKSIEADLLEILKK